MKDHVTSCECAGDDPLVCTIVECGRADLGFVPNASGSACEPVVTTYVYLDPGVQLECDVGAALTTQGQSVVFRLRPPF